MSLAWIVLSLFLATPTIPTLTARVNDLAGVIAPAVRADLTRRLESFEEEEGTQVVVLTVRTVGDLSIERFADAAARANGIWRWGPLGGVLIVVEVAGQRCRIEPATGLRASLPEALCETIVREKMEPRIGAETYGDGVAAGAQAVMDALRGKRPLLDLRAANVVLTALVTRESAYLLLTVLAVLMWVALWLRRRKSALGLAVATCALAAGAEGDAFRAVWGVLGAFVWSVIPALMVLLILHGGRAKHADPGPDP